MKFRLVKQLSKRFRMSRDANFIRHAFDTSYYLNTNRDLRNENIDPVLHYIKRGWKEGRDPTPDFSTNGYLMQNPDVLQSGINPFVHYLKYGRHEGRVLRASSGVPDLPFSGDPFVARAAHYVQDQNFPLEAERAENILVILVPEHNEMSGGIYSFFSIAKSAYNLRHKHDYFILVMTRPNPMDLTYNRQRNFRNSEDVFRFNQIVRCKAAKTIYLQIPEYASVDFVKNLGQEQLSYLKSREKFFVNILNQKTDIMPEKEEFEDLRAISTEITQSVAHHAYFGQQFAERYNLPTLLLPAFTDLSNYEPIEYEDKEKLIIYSPDDAPYKSAVLEKLQQELPDYTLREIRGITFDRFMDLATRCRFSITFGEGFDGYLAQPIHQGGVGFAVYNDEFFPTKELLQFDNIFTSSDEMINGISERIRALESDRQFYQKTNMRMIELYDQLYSRADYIRRIEMLINRDFELRPLSAFTEAASIRL